MRTIAAIGIAFTVLLVWSVASSAQTTLTIHCPGPRTLQEAIDRAERVDGAVTIEFDGSCVEDLSIQRSDLSLVGLSPAAELVGGLTIDGAVRVVLTGFGIDGSAGHGVHLRSGAQATLEDLLIQNAAADGVLVEGGSSARLTEVEATSCGTDGIAVELSSSVVLSGAVAAVGNGSSGLVVSENSTARSDPATVNLLELNDNVDWGVLVAFSSVATLDQVTLSGNWTAAFVIFQSELVLSGGQITTNTYGVSSQVYSDFTGISLDISGNSETAVWCLSDASFLLAASTVTANGPIGMLAEDSCVAFFNQTVEVSGHATAGLWVDGSIANVTDTTVLDSVVAEFGSRLDFVSGNSVAMLTCDATVLSRGDHTCPLPPAPTLLSGDDMERLERTRSDLVIRSRALVRGHRPRGRGWSP